MSKKPQEVGLGRTALITVNPSPRKASPDAISANPSASHAPSTAKSGKARRREVSGAISLSSATTRKKGTADQDNVEIRSDTKIKLKESDDRFTSPKLIRAIEGSFGKIDFDPCWHKASAVNPSEYLDVRQGHDGLRDQWSGRLVFVNPPWSAQDKWLKRAYAQWLRGNVHTVVCLVPAATGAAIFHHILARDADVYFLEGRPEFFKEDETSEGTMRPVMVVMFGATNQQKIRFAELVKGSWWLPVRPSSVATKEDVIENPGPVSRFAPYPLSDAVAMVHGANSAPRHIEQLTASNSRAVFFSDCRPGPAVRVCCGPA
jgi:hypothetical protein